MIWIWPQTFIFANTDGALLFVRSHPKSVLPLFEGAIDWQPVIPPAVTNKATYRREALAATQSSHELLPTGHFVTWPRLDPVLRQSRAPSSLPPSLVVDITFCPVYLSRFCGYPHLQLTFIRKKKNLARQLEVDCGANGSSTFVRGTPKIPRLGVRVGRHVFTYLVMTSSCYTVTWPFLQRSTHLWVS